MITRARHVGLTTLMLGLLCLAATPQQAHAQKYRLVDLGAGGANGINSQGTVVGNAIVPPGTSNGATWSATGSRTLTGEWPGDLNGDAYFINDQGTVLGKSRHIAPGGNQHSGTVNTAFVWHPSTGLQAAPWGSAHPDATPTAINNLGHITLTRVQPNGSQLMLWRSPTDYTYIVNPGGATPLTATGLNDLGQVIGQAAGNGPMGTDPAYFWSASTGYVNIPSPSSTFSNIAVTAINAQGQVAGFLQNPQNGRTKLFSWTAQNGTTVLQPLTSYEGELYPISIDAKTYRVIGNRRYTSDPSAFVWTILGGVRDINNLLVNNGSIFAPIAKVTKVTQVNSQGQISAIATINGEAHAVRLDPVP